MFVIGLLVLMGLFTLFMLPDFDQWDNYKHMLYSRNPFEAAIGFIMCTVSAIEFIVWYLVFYQLLRVIVYVWPFLIVYIVVRLLMA